MKDDASLQLNSSSDSIQKSSQIKTRAMRRKQINGTINKETILSQIEETK